MARKHTILLVLSLVILFSYTLVEGGTNQNQVAFSRKGLKEERKLAVSGMIPSLSGLSGQATSTTNAGAVNNNAEITNADTGGATAYTPMSTATTTDSHHDISVDQYRRIIHNNQLNKP